MRRVLLASAFLASALLSWSSAGAPAVPPFAPRHESTNVVLVSLQCLRPDHLGCYGYKRPTSPNIDKIAASSVVFENQISQANLTPVSMMSVLTSQYPRVNGMVAFDVAKDSVSTRTLPEVLKQYGYATAAASGSPEFFMRYDGETGAVIDLGDVFSRSIDKFMRTRRAGAPSLRKSPTEALEWIDANRGNKFFLWVASGVAHVPYAAAIPTAEKTIYDTAGYVPFWNRFPAVSGEEGSPDDPTYDVLMRIFDNDYYLGFKPVHRLTSQDHDYIEGRYDAAIRHTDRFIGDLIARLEKNGLLDKTILVIHSIHGEEFGERGTYVHHDFLSESVLKNALLVRFPGGEGGGRRVPEQVQGIDLAPTILEYLGIPVDHGMQGKSMLPLVRGDSSAWDEYAFIDRIPWWEHTLSRWYLESKNRQIDYPADERDAFLAYGDKLRKAFPPDSYPPGDIAVRTNRWKLVLRRKAALQGEVSWYGFITGRPRKYEEVEMYDLVKDPLERVNVAGKHPEVEKGLMAKLLEWDASVERRKAKYGVGEKRFIIPYP